MEPKEIVRRGYDALSYRYRGDAEEPAWYATWLGQLQERVPAGGAILDLGCGNGVPLARDLAAGGYAVTGVDLSAVQVERARELVPAARFLHADAAQVEFPAASFDAVVSLYTLIHLPLDEQPALLGRIGRWLRPAGWLLVTTGQQAWTGTEDGWLGGDTPMWWSHADAPTYRRWIEQAGLDVVTQEVVPEGDSAHALFWARRPPGEGSATVPGRTSAAGPPTHRRLHLPQIVTQTGVGSARAQPLAPAGPLHRSAAWRNNRSLAGRGRRRTSASGRNAASSS